MPDPQGNLTLSLPMGDKKLPGIAAEDIAAVEAGNMFQFYVDFENELLKTRDVAMSRKLNPELQNLDEWLSRNRAKFSV